MFSEFAKVSGRWRIFVSGSGKGSPRPVNAYPHAENLPPLPAPIELVFLPFVHEGDEAPAVFLPCSAELPTCPAPVFLFTASPAPTV